MNGSNLSKKFRKTKPASSAGYDTLAGSHLTSYFISGLALKKKKNRRCGKNALRCLQQEQKCVQSEVEKY